MARDFQLGDYIDVPSRIAEAREKWPDGRLRPVNPHQPYRVETIGNAKFVVYTAAFYRTHDDPMPGIGVAWEPFPGKTPYTKDSELQNAETSAWGRAIVAALIADAKKGIASAEEVRNRQADQEAEWEAAKPPTNVQLGTFNGLMQDITEAGSPEEIRDLGGRAKGAEHVGDLTKYQYEQLARRAAARLAEMERGTKAEPDGGDVG